MQPPWKARICFAQRAGLILMAAQAMSASSLPMQYEPRYRVWKLATEAGTNHGQPVPGSDPAAGIEAPKATLGGPPAKPETPVDLRPDVPLYVFHFPSGVGSGPSRGMEMAIWMLLGAAAVVVTTADTRHHRRRALAGYRHPRIAAGE